MRLGSISISAALALAFAAPGYAQQPVTAVKSTPAAAAVAVEKFDASVARRITIDDVKKRIDAGEKVVVLDIRGSVSGPIAKGAEHVPGTQLAEWAKDKDKDLLIVTYCT